MTERPVHVTVGKLGKRKRQQTGSQYPPQRHSPDGLAFPTRHHNLNSCLFSVILQAKNPGCNMWSLKAVQDPNYSTRGVFVLV